MASRKLNITKKSLLKWFCLSLILCVCVGIFAFIFVCKWIGFEVKTQCQSAKKQYRGDCVQALIYVLEDDQQNYRARNDAIWSLGMLGDKRAVPILERFYTGEIPPREPLDKTISQYELRKAINLAKGGKNITTVFWRYDID